MFVRCFLLLAALLASDSAFAQARSVNEGLKREALPTVFVLDDRGVETKGRLKQLSDEAVVLLIDGSERRIDARRIQRITRRGDSLRNGVIAGAVVGLVLGVLGSSLADCRDGDRYGACGIGTRVALTAGSTAFYTAIGTGLDALVEGRMTLYERTPVERARGSNGGMAVAARIRW